MRVLGLIGGMSWESTALYYSNLNKGIESRLDGLHSAKMILANVDFQEIVDFQRSGRWSEAGALLADCAKRLVTAGAEGVALAVNTMHKVAPQVSCAISVPFLDIRDAVATRLRNHNIKACGLLGTSYVMKEEFYRRHVETVGECDVRIPPIKFSEDLNDIIYGELSKGIVTRQSRMRVLEIIGELHREGAQGVILGCTELPMLNLDDDSPVPLFDSTQLHVEMCLDFMTRTEAKVS